MIAINMKYTKLFLFTFLSLFLSTSIYSQLVNNSAELNSAISSASPGDIIILADGEWNNTFIDINKNGSENQPITITAQNPGVVFLTGNSRVVLEGSYLIFSGFIFKDPSNLSTSGSNIRPVIELDGCDYCTVTNNEINAYNGTEAQKTMTFKWILNDGQYNEISYNSFIGKYGVGSIINDNRGSGTANYLSIHHNYFADRTPINGINDDNDQDAIRIGQSATSLTDSNSEVYNNYFANFFGEIEVISNKSGRNKYYNNTFRNYSGTLTLRHGDNCEVYNNYFFADDNLFSGGVRVIGEGHKVYNNYIEGVNSIKPDGSTSNATGGINVTNGRLDSEINGYYQVKNAVVVNNTFVNCDYGLRIGTTVANDLDQAPENLVVANNIMYQSSVEDYQIETAPIGTSLSEGNITALPENAMADDGDFHRIMTGAMPIDAGLGNYAFLGEDILGGSRDATIDAGAEEFGAGGTNLPYNEFDVGINMGFGSTSAPTLASFPGELTFSIYADTMTFLVLSNVDWTLESTVSWLSLDVTSGSGNTAIQATVLENMTGAERTGSVILNESPTSSLTNDLEILQLNTFLPSEITIVGTTSLGMQDKEGIEEVNAYDDDLTTYWTGDPDEEVEVSITFDLACKHELTDIGINFWKADERTTTFSISVADEENGTYRLLLDNVESADNGETVQDEQFFPLNTIARYVKFTGIGNSSSSNWTSIANVNIYGDTECTTASSIYDPQGVEVDIDIYPNPAKDLINIDIDGKLDFKASLFNIDGKLLRQVLNRTQIDINTIQAGTYLLEIQDIESGQKIVEQILIMK